MKFLLTLLALVLAAGAPLAGAAPTSSAPPAAARSGTPAAPADTFAIPASSAGARPPALTTPTAEGASNMLQVIQNGGWAMYPLGFLSVAGVMLVLVYLVTLRRSSILTAHYMNTADVLLKKRDYLGLLAISSRHTEVVSRIVQRTLDFATKNPGTSYQVLQDIAQTEGSAQAASLQHRVTYLADIGVIAPMIGLLGTVSGIIRAFAKLGSGDAGIGRDILLASGVSEALIATATGLVLGITSMGFYAIFRNRVHSLISDMEIATAHIMGMLALSFTKKRDGGSRVTMEEEF